MQIYEGLNQEMGKETGRRKKDYYIFYKGLGENIQCPMFNGQ
jgi:hypothetical protein